MSKSGRARSWKGKRRCHVMLSENLWEVLVDRAHVSGLSASALVERTLVEGLGLTSAQVVVDPVESKRKPGDGRYRRNLLVDRVVWDQLKVEGRRRGLSVAAVVRERLRDAAGGVGTDRSHVEKVERSVAEKATASEISPGPATNSISIFDF